MNEREAVLRLMYEIIGFTDRPDYIRPESVREAFEVLYEKYGIEESYIYEHYCEYESEPYCEYGGEN